MFLFSIYSIYTITIERQRKQENIFKLHTRLLNYDQ